MHTSVAVLLIASSHDVRQLRILSSVGFCLKLFDFNSSIGDLFCVIETDSAALPPCMHGTSCRDTHAWACAVNKPQAIYHCSVHGGRYRC